MRAKTMKLGCWSAALACAVAIAVARPLPTALLPFMERGQEVNGLGAKVNDLLFAELADADAIWLVDRQDIGTTLAEMELSASGMVDPGQAVKIGSLTGAKVLISGSVFEVDGRLHLVAKIIGAETSRALGASISGGRKGELAPQVAALAEKIVEAIEGNAEKLVAPDKENEDAIAVLKKAIGGSKLPTAYISVAERHVGRQTIDPAAETELSRIYKEVGGTVVDKGAAATARIRVEGEGFSEFATRRGDLVGVKARVEVKAVDAETGAVLAVDRETAVVVDLSEQIAAKTALQKAAATIAARMLPKLAEKER